MTILRSAAVQRRPAARRTARANTVRGLLLLAPFLVLYLTFVGVPAAYGVWLSFTDSGLMGGGLGDWVGWGNYAEVLSNPQFWGSVRNTLWFLLLTTPPAVILALILAVLTNRMRRGRWFPRVAFFAPYVMPVSVLALVWTWVYSPALGLLTNISEALFGSSPAWLSDPQWAMPSIAIASIWGSLGFTFVLYTAGLQEIPTELYDAATVDGASGWQQTWFVTLPLLRRTTLLVTMLELIGALKVFDQIYLLTGGGPNFATRSVVGFIFDYGFTSYRVGFASAASLILFVFVLVLSAAWFATSRRLSKEDGS
ncbi:carbohydrate ABC transporter permease [Occultella gossypii]|uniref:Sugar ABC transporter permease n=1 Tax=Occultella gossypii TaxID=2800820 RepID=A0ABS7SCG8_9MICO|nr:sugar ABC transporter permease [Occultella gossypii]MBZ2197962.1 sugar ABC transporter permease [Occultella gossypii]